MKLAFSEYLDELTTLRRDLHANPEIGFEEVRTAQIISTYLKACGVDEVHEGIGGTGVVGIINGQSSGKSIAFRADMDALPMQEDVPGRAHRSSIPERFHGCGHDGHTAMLLGAARYLAAQRNFAGRIVLIFQPAEEKLSGAQKMIEDGLLKRFAFDEIYGLHNMPGLSSGEFVINEAAALSGSNSFTLTLYGKGGHGAMPHLTVDPIIMATRVITDFQTIISRSINPLQQAVLSFGQIHAGTAPNIIPDTLHMSGTLRTYDKDVHTHIKERMHAIADSVAQGFNGRIELDFNAGTLPLINDAELAAEAVKGLKALLTDHPVRLAQTPLGPSEDFSYYLQHVRGVYAFLGQGDTPMCHHAHYDFDDSLIPLGIAYWISIAQNRLPLITEGSL